MAREGVRLPVRIKAEFAVTETCCACGAKHRSGIYVRGVKDVFSKCVGHAD